MYQSLDLFRTAAAMAQHAGARQALTARNVANADTPGYQALKMPSFRESYDQNAAAGMQQTRLGHVTGGSMQSLVNPAATEPSPNGNTVSIEEEMLDAVAISREHNRALAIYRHTMTVLRTTLGR